MPMWVTARVAYLWRIHIGVGNGSEFSLSRHRVTSFNLFGQAQNNKKEARWIDKNEAPVQGLTFTQAYLLCKMSQQQLAE